MTVAAREVAELPGGGERLSELHPDAEEAPRAGGPRPLQQRAVGSPVDKTEVGEPRLARAEELALAAQLQVLKLLIVIDASEPEPIDLDRWRQALTAGPEPPRSGNTILCVAHLYPRKDVGTLIAAMARLPSDAVLRIVGTGPELARLRRQAGELKLERRVEFLGHVAFDRLAGEYGRADIFCLPSRQEGFGIVFLEAMAAGAVAIALSSATEQEHSSWRNAAAREGERYGVEHEYVRAGMEGRSFGNTQNSRSLLDWLLIVGTTTLFILLATVARLPLMDISIGWGVALSVAMLALLAAGGIVLWRTTRFR